MSDTLKVAVVVPCYKVRTAVLDVLARIPPEVDRIFCVDDACPEESGQLIREMCRDPRVEVIVHDRNRGVGGAVKTGYLAARAAGCAVIAVRAGNFAGHDQSAAHQVIETLDELTPELARAVAEAAAAG